MFETPLFHFSADLSTLDGEKAISMFHYQSVRADLGQTVAEKNADVKSCYDTICHGAWEMHIHQKI